MFLGCVVTAGSSGGVGGGGVVPGEEDISRQAHSRVIIRAPYS